MCQEEDTKALVRTRLLAHNQGEVDFLAQSQLLLLASYILRRRSNSNRDLAKLNSGQERATRKV